jgi:hypothetical protein
MFETNIVEKNETHVLGSVIFSPGNLAFLRYCGKM